MNRPAIVVLAGLLASGCASTRAAAPIERPALDVPPPPPRIIEVAPLPEPPAEPVSEPLPPPVATAPVKPRPAAPREVKGSDAVKTEAKTEPAPQPEAAPAAPPSNAAPPAPLLRTPATADTAGAERQIRETLARARGGLASINTARLTGERKKAFAEANDYIERAEAAMQGSNLELAKELADKAEKYSKELQGR